MKKTYILKKSLYFYPDVFRYYAYKRACFEPVNVMDFEKEIDLTEPITFNEEFCVDISIEKIGGFYSVLLLPTYQTEYYNPFILFKSEKFYADFFDECLEWWFLKEKDGALFPYMESVSVVIDDGEIDKYFKDLVVYEHKYTIKRYNKFEGLSIEEIEEKFGKEAAQEAYTDAIITGKNPSRHLEPIEVLEKCIDFTFFIKREERNIKIQMFANIPETNKLKLLETTVLDGNHFDLKDVKNVYSEITNTMFKRVKLRYNIKWEYTKKEDSSLLF